MVRLTAVPLAVLWALELLLALVGAQAQESGQVAAEGVQRAVRNSRSSRSRKSKERRYRAFP